MSLSKEKCGRTFQRIEDPRSLLPILESRLPLSCCVINLLANYDAFKDNFSAFTFEEKEESSCNGEQVVSLNGKHELNGGHSNVWIAFNYKRDDWGNCIGISSPIPNADNIPDQVKRALESSKIVDWSDQFVFLNIDLNIADYLIHMNIRQFGNIIKVFPCYMFYMSPKDAANVEVPKLSSGTLGPLDPVKGAEFFANIWNFSNEKTVDFVLKSVPHVVSGAVHLPNGEIVCAAFASPAGNITMLVTHPDHRRKGYASMVLRYLYRELGKRGFHVCLETAITNGPGVALHSSINPNIIAKVDYICHNAL